MSGPIVIIDSSEVREGKLEELKAVICEMVEFVEANEARPISFSVYLKEDGTEMTVIQTHPDSESMELHMKAAGHVFPEFTPLIKMSRMDIYGELRKDLVEQLRQKAKMLGGASVGVHERHAGFARFGVR